MDSAAADYKHKQEPIAQLIRACEKQRKFFDDGSTRPVSFRRSQLLKIKKLLEENEQEILDALHKDLQKPAYEAYASEIGFLVQEVNLAIRKLNTWAKPRKVSTGILSMPSSSRIVPQPKGVCLIIAPWNYPFQLIIAPMIAAIAAGNTVVLKPAEHTPATGELVQKLIGHYFEPELARVMLGDGAELIPKLMDYFRFDHVFFTGSIAVGRKIALQAAEKLVPVTLELGGKNPCIVDRDANLGVAAQRILWAKVLNAGQTCIAPDYLLVHAEIIEEFKVRLVEVLNEFYPEGALMDENYSGIVDRTHLARLKSFLQEGEVFYGGRSDEDSLRMEPCLMQVDNVESGVMQNEIFGPVLPIISWHNTDDAREIIEENSHPLSLYYFGKDKKREEFFTERIASGGVMINNAVIHFVNSELPFGGVGSSGYGSYHGYFGFKTFSHFKGVMKSGTWLDPKFKYPPYSGWLIRAVRRLMR